MSDIITANVNIKKLSPDAKLPTYGSEFAAGCDLYACIPEPLTIEPGQTVLVKTGLSMEIPVGYAGLIYARSGLAIKHGIGLLNSVGVIDSDYRGEICVGLINQLSEPYTIMPDERIAQMVIKPVSLIETVEVDELDETLRGTGGFGSTGKK